MNKYEMGISPDRLTELAQAERDGRVVVLPCKIGDTVYSIRGGNDILIEATPRTVLNFYYDEGKWWLGFSNSRNDVDFSNFGKTAFLTRSEAEAKLKEMESN